MTEESTIINIKPNTSLKCIEPYSEPFVLSYIKSVISNSYAKKKNYQNEIIKESNLLMYPEESLLLLNYYMNSSVYFEYGMGGSTILACLSSSNLIIYSIDSNMEWIDNIQKNKCIQHNLNNGIMANFKHNHSYHRANNKRIFISLADIGPVVKWGYPLNNDHRNKWNNYYESINIIRDKVDLVLVDGRFRVACALYALLVTKNTTRIIFHDFLYEHNAMLKNEKDKKIRKHYHIVLSYANIIACTKTMVILQRKLDVNMTMLEMELYNHRFDPQ
eukprot:gene10669-14326_t